MKNITSILACPGCHRSLELKAVVEGSIGIEEGTLICTTCKNLYSIKDGIFYLNHYFEEQEVKDKKDYCNIEDFQDMYLEEGYHKSHIEYLEKRQGLSRRSAETIGRYENSRVKGRLLEWISPANGDVIIDLGCGVGYFIFDIIKRYQDIDVNLIGIDALTKCVKYLTQRQYEEGRENILPLVGSAEYLPFEDCSIDIVVSSELLEHISNPQKALIEINRVLKKNGKLLISTPNRMALEFWQSLSNLKKRLGLSKREDVYNEEFYDEPLYWKTLKGFSESAGLTIKRYEFNVNPLMRKILMGFPKDITNKFVELLESWLKGERWGVFTLVEFQKL